MAELARNKRAYFDYEILDSFEAGLVLTGQEVKSAKKGGAQLTGAYARIIGGEMQLINAHIKPYAYASNLTDYDPTQTRKLLMHKSEIEKLSGKIQEKGLTLLPLELYTLRGKVKVKLGLGRSKKKQDKRESIKRRDDNRNIRRAIRRN